MSSARLLPTLMVEKVWGRDQLPPPFATGDARRIGEIWFEPPDEISSVLVKYLFTSDKLSVQVHPPQSALGEGEQAKEECWLVLDAEEGARLGIGFREPIDSDAMRAAALDGSIEHLLEWHAVKPGDFFHLPPGTVHAIGAGISLVEVQQNSDTTFRLYDYGRPRELHLDRAIEVADGARYPASLHRRIDDKSKCLVDGAHFRLDRIIGAPDGATREAWRGALLALPLSGSIAQGDVRARGGECLLTTDLGAIDFDRAEITLLARAA